MLSARPADDLFVLALRRTERAQRPRHRGRQARRRGVIEQPLDRGRRVTQRVVGAAGNRRVAGGPEHPQAQRGHPLLADRDGHHPPPVGELEQRPAALVEGVVAAQVGALANQPRHADVGGVALLVRLGDQDHVAGRALDASRQRGEGDSPRRELVLHVGRPAADQPSVAHRALEWIDRPAGARRRDDVGVGDQHQRRPLPRAGDPRDQVEPSGIGPDQLRLDPGAGEVLGEQLGGRGLVAGRIRGVEANQRPGEVDDLAAQSGIGHRSPASRRTASSGNSSCIVPSRRCAGRAATRQL